MLSERFADGQFKAQPIKAQPGPRPALWHAQVDRAARLPSGAVARQDLTPAQIHILEIERCPRPPVAPDANAERPRYEYRMVAGDHAIHYSRLDRNHGQL